MLVTLYLLVLIVGLIIGHGFLYLSRREENSSALVPANNSGLNAASAPEVRIVDEKANMAHNRLTKLERHVLSGKSAVPADVKQRLERLDNFRANTEVELKAIKEIIAEMPKKRKEKKKKAEVKKEKDLERKIHERVFNKRKRAKRNLERMKKKRA